MSKGRLKTGWNRGREEPEDKPRTKFVSRDNMTGSFEESGVGQKVSTGKEFSQHASPQDSCSIKRLPWSSC